MASEPAQASQISQARQILGGSAGNLVEWYDWYAYSAFALYFAPSFFPKGDALAQALNTAAVFAVGFLMRPIGGWILGVYADRQGRKAALTLSVAMMCAGSLMIAVSPTYAQVGLLAPLLLLVARLVQGLSVGGEYGASATFMSEVADERRRGFLASFQYVTLIGGQLLALGLLVVMQATLTEAQLNAWGWRVPFLVGAACAVLVFFLRRSLVETEAFQAVSAKEHQGLMRCRRAAVSPFIPSPHTCRNTWCSPPAGPSRRRPLFRRWRWSDTWCCNRCSGRCRTASGGGRCSSPSACSARC
jgi:MHS family alpha-ketoglutarate permease-like MFS transporter